MRKSHGIGLALSVSLLTSALVYPQAASATHCSVRAGITTDPDLNEMRGSGSISCGSGSGTRRLTCKIVHKHTIGWHSHANVLDLSRRSNISTSGGTLTGTNGDTYKTNCKGYYNGSYQMTHESGAYTL